MDRAHDIRGDASIDVRTDEPERRLQPGFEFRFASRGELVPERIHQHRGGLVVSFRGYPDRTIVETLCGKRLLVDASTDETPSEPEEHFDQWLIRFRVLDTEDRRIGEAVEVLHLLAQNRLTTETSSGRRLVPFVSALVIQIGLTVGEV